MDRKIAIFQHVKNEPSGMFHRFFEERNIPVEEVHLYNTHEVPRLPGVTHYLFLGGPMSVNDEPEYPWLKQEKDLIRHCVKAGKNVLGICLGAQLIASAHHAPVFPFVKETGWCRLSRVLGATRSFADFPDTFHVFQLHGETFEIPYKGQLLARGEQVKNQAFSVGTALGLQFHLELTDEIVQDWSRDLTKYQKSKIARDTPRYLAESNRLCRLVADRFVR